MNREDASTYVSELYAHLLHRAPGAGELGNWTDAVLAAGRPEAMFRAFVQSPEYLRRNRVVATFPPGHYHSPVVDPETIRPYYAWSQALTPTELDGIEIDLDAMLQFWDGLLDVIRTTRFPERPTPERRFSFEGSPFPWGDAIALRAMLSHHRPSRIIEIGSGFSTACMLDTADEFGSHDLRITCIEPYPDRLRSLLRAGDEQRIELIETVLQEVPLDRFDVLGPGDFLFIDSTHVLKTGSDVHYELFHILPRLKAGVIVHVHDCPFPFEYPKEWVIDRNFSWNEAYALRAFLMFNARFSIDFWGSCLARIFREKLERDCPDFLRNAGTSIWLRTNPVPASNGTEAIG